MKNKKKSKHTNIHIIEIGKNVACDICNYDFTDSDDSGGFLFETFAYCPKCASESLARIQSYGEEQYIKGYCPEGMSFREWVLKLRNGDNTIKIISGDRPLGKVAMKVISEDGHELGMT